MTLILFQKQTCVNHETPTQSTITYNYTKATLKANQLAIATLVLLQLSSCIISHLNPERASLVQGLVLTASLSVFLSIHRIQVQEKKHLEAIAPACYAPKRPLLLLKDIEPDQETQGVPLPQNPDIDGKIDAALNSWMQYFKSFAPQSLLRKNQ
jgi:hypothetical protein